jgi:hypothetical protein
MCLAYTKPWVSSLAFPHTGRKEGRKGGREGGRKEIETSQDT